VNAWLAVPVEFLAVMVSGYGPLASIHRPIRVVSGVSNVKGAL
jgi:hypothetical protein